MKWLHKLRASSYFVDVILLIAAVVAMAGLATFVRLHTTKAPDEASTKSTIAMGEGQTEKLQPEHTATNTSESSTTNSSALQSAVRAPENASAAALCAKSCDDLHITSVSNNQNEQSITVQPTRQCGGLVKRAVDTMLKNDEDTAMCSLN